MEAPERSAENIKELLLSTVRSTGFWSSVAGVVGVVAIVVGGTTLLAVDELRDFGISLLIVGLALLVVAPVLSPRATATFLIGRQGRYGTNVVVMTVAFFAIVVLVNFLLDRNPTRLDVTATRVFTLAPQTVQVLDSLETPIRANAFFVPTDIRLDAARQRAEDLLNEFARQTSKFSFRFIDPELKRNLALQFDVTRHPVIVFEHMDLGTQQPAFALNEQEFVTGILVVTGVEQKKVRFLTGHKERSITREGGVGDADNEGFDFALEGLLRDNYIVRALSLRQEAEVPDDTAVLIIAGPKQDLDSSEQEALMDYIKSGGRIIALFEPDTPDSFVDLITPWGVTLSRKRVADTVSNVAGELLTPLLQRTNDQFVTRPDLLIADQIDVAFFPETTSIELLIEPEDIPPTVRITPLAITTPASWLESDAENVNFDPGVDPLGPFALATAVEARGTIDETEEHEIAKFVLFGDSDFAKNLFFFSDDNSNLFLNSVNWLAEDFELISIRPKLFPSRRLVVNTREADFIKWSSWFFPPAVMVLLGVVVWWRRR